MPERIQFGILISMVLGMWFGINWISWCDILFDILPWYTLLAIYIGVFTISILIIISSLGLIGVFDKDKRCIPKKDKPIIDSDGTKFYNNKQIIEKLSKLDTLNEGSKQFNEIRESFK